MIVYLIFPIIINKILSECYDRCNECTELGDSTYHKCNSCKYPNTYLLDTNCYYDYELPHCYFNSDDSKFYFCSNDCYECNNNANECVSCYRGYSYNSDTKTCTPCNSNTYIYVSDGVELCKTLENGRFACELKFTECTDININTENHECPRKYPLLIEGSETKECALEKYVLGTHTISNQIIKTQWLNNIIILGVGQCWYIKKSYSSNEDLILETNVYNDSIKNDYRYFYGIKSNGRPLFYDSTNEVFTEEKILEAITDYKLFESQSIKINLVNDDKDYYLTCSFTNCSIEITDFYNNKIIGISQYVFFGEFYWSTKIFDIIGLTNEPNVYLFCFIIINSPSYVHFQKFKFFKPDLREDDSYEKILASENTADYSAIKSKIISCFEIVVYNLIQCFYLNTNKFFVVSLFNENDFQLVKTTIIDESSTIVGYIDNEEWDYFFQNILIKNQRSILSYVLDPTSHIVYIQIKNLIYNNIDNEYTFEDHFSYNRIISINSDRKYSLTSIFFLTELKKLDDNRFFLILTSENLFNIYIVLFDFYDNDSGLFIRYYHIPFKLLDYRIFEFILGVNFNGFLGLVFTVQNFWWIPATQYFSIFGYIKGADSDLITMTSDTTLTLSEYINEQYIENNLFGYAFKGVKILKLPQDIGIYYLSKNKNKLISENDILDPSDVIIFVYDYMELILGNLYTIEIAGVVQEPSFTEFNKYPEYTEFYGTVNPENHLTQRSFIGQTCFYNFTITNDLTGTNDGTCINNCKVCYEGYCVKCLEDFHINEDLDICLINDFVEGYYYEGSSRSYKPCHELCRTCSIGPILDSNGEIVESKCDICIDTYFKVNKPINCISCHENCKTCEGKKKNSTYFSCISCDETRVLYEKSTNCLNCPFIGQYANYYQYKCIENIPDGYYLKNSVTNIIDKCYITCKHCTIPGDKNDHKCTECADAFPYNYNNGEKCLDDCAKENLYLESENNFCYDDCSENILNDKKYNYKNKCISLDYTPKNYVLDESNNFVSKCDPKNDYEFNNECYSSCPDGTIKDESKTEKNVCKCKSLYYLDDEFYVCINTKSCPNDYPYLKIGTSECTNCPVRYKGQCFLECPDGTCITQINENLATCVDKLDETKILAGLCFDDFLRILDEIDSSSTSNKVMNTSPGITINIYITSVYSEVIKSNKEKLTFIDLGECETKLREYFKITPEQKFCVISVEALTKKSNQPTNDFDYEIYLDNGTQITDFSPCKDNPIEVSSPIINFDLINYEEALIFDDQGYDIYNPESSFYTDKCTAAYINGNDIIIRDRIKDIYPVNISYCPNNCQLVKTELEAKRFNCSCYLSSAGSNENDEAQLNIQTDESYIAYLLDMINYKLFGCPKIIINSSFNDYITNIGLYLGGVLILYNLISFVIFFCYFLYQIRLEMFRQIPTKLKLFERAKKLKKKETKKDIENNENNTEKKEFNSINLLDNGIIPANPKNKKTSKNLFTENNELKLKKKLNKKKAKYITEENRINNDISSKTNNNVLSSFKKYQSKINDINEEIELEKSYMDKIILNDDIDINEYNQVPYTQALRIDNRNFLLVFISLIKMKIDIISVIFYPEEFTHRSLLLSIYLLDFLFNYFINALLYSDDVISQKYHNNGYLDFVTSLTLSLASNIISSIVVCIISKLTNYHELLQTMVKDINNERSFIYLFHKVYRYIKIRIFLYYLLNLLVIVIITYYLFIFCEIYKKSQISLLINYFLGIGESMLKSFGVSFVVCILRFISLKCKSKRLYRISVYLNNLF